MNLEEAECLQAKLHSAVKSDSCKQRAATAMKARPLNARISTPLTTFTFSPQRARQSHDGFPCMPASLKLRKSVSPGDTRTKLDVSASSPGRICATGKLYSPRSSFPIRFQKMQTSPHEFPRVYTPRNWLSSARIARVNLGCNLPAECHADSFFAPNFAPTVSRAGSAKPRKKSAEPNSTLKDKIKKLPLEQIIPRSADRTSPLVKLIPKQLKRLPKAKSIRQDDSFSLCSWKVQTPRS